MARQIGKMLNAREPKIVNGPEILNKFVGASEENIRKLFEDAEKEVGPPPPLSLPPSSPSLWPRCGLTKMDVLVWVCVVQGQGRRERTAHHHL